jgi:riboflavin biosynthesis pyrimidine reductase
MLLLAMHLNGLSQPFTLLFEDDVTSGVSLPDALRMIYAGDWHVSEFADRPYVYSNFVQSRDGRVSFSVPGHMGGEDVSGFNQHDKWLMGLLRARADAVVMGDTTLKIEPEHIWTSDYIYPTDPALFLELRRLENRRDYPLQVFLSLDGNLHAEARVFCESHLHIVIATTQGGAEQAASLKCQAKLDVLILGEGSVDIQKQAGVDIQKLCSVLYSDYGVKTLLCEGGPRAYGSFLAAQRIDEEFLTLAPTVIGNDAGKLFRPSLVEGVAFMPEHYPKSKPVSMRRAGDHLFLRSRYVY